MSRQPPVPTGLARLPVVPLLVALLVLHCALHLRYLDLPPSGFHAWRQTQVLSIARNFHEESMNLLEPRVDSRGARSGITGLEFPLPYYLTAVGYRLFGFQDRVHRVVQLLFSLVAILGCYRLGRRLFGAPHWGLAAAAMLVLDPLFGYYSFVAIPDVPMIGFVFLGFAALLDWAKSARARDAAAAAAALSVAALFKLSAAALWPAAALILFEGLRRADARRRALAILSVSLGLLPVAAWYLWARHLSEAHQNWDFLLGTKFPYPLAIVPGIVRKVLLQWLPEVYDSYPQFALVVIGLASVRSTGPRLLGPVLIACALGLVAYGSTILPMLGMHDYFMTPVLLPLVLLVTVGLHRLASSPSRAATAVLVALVAAAAVVGPWRALSRFERAHLDPDLASMEARLPALIPDRSALVIAASDASPSIYLYSMHRKGWSATAEVSAAEFATMVAEGARYLVSDSRALEARADVCPRLVPAGSVGKFKVFRLADPAAPAAASPPAPPPASAAARAPSARGRETAR